MVVGGAPAGRASIKLEGTGCLPRCTGLHCPPCCGCSYKCKTMELFALANSKLGTAQSRLPAVPFSHGTVQRRPTFKYAMRNSSLDQIAVLNIPSLCGLVGTPPSGWASAGAASLHASLVGVMAHPSASPSAISWLVLVMSTLL